MEKNYTIQNSSECTYTKSTTYEITTGYFPSPKLYKVTDRDLNKQSLPSEPIDKANNIHQTQEPTQLFVREYG